MKKWHITITENETGATALDIDTDAIILGADEDESTRVIHMVSAPVTAHAAAICCLIETIDQAKKDNPFLAFLVERAATELFETEEN